MKRIQGFSAVEITILVVVLAIAGGVGYVAWNKFMAKDSKTESSQTASSDTQKPTEISNKDDLDKALETVDSTSVDDDDVSTAESQANF